jgi:hypothetical protein
MTPLTPTPIKPQPGTVTGNTSATNAPKPAPNNSNHARDWSQDQFDAAMRKLNVRF